MKRLISAALASTLALSLLGATAASAAPVNGPLNGSVAPVDYRYYHPYHHHDDGNGAAIAAGIGFLALTAILASQHHHDRDDWDDRDYGYRDYGYRNYDRGYGYAAPYGGYGYGYATPYSGYRGW
jgi:hypothetical protein